MPGYRESDLIFLHIDGIEKGEMAIVRRHKQKRIIVAGFAVRNIVALQRNRLATEKAIHLSANDETMQIAVLIRDAWNSMKMDGGSCAGLIGAQIVQCAG